MDADLAAAQRVIDHYRLTRACGCVDAGRRIIAGTACGPRWSHALPCTVCGVDGNGDGTVLLTPAEVLAVDEYGRPCGELAQEFWAWPGAMLIAPICPDDPVWSDWVARAVHVGQTHDGAAVAMVRALDSGEGA